MREPSIARHAAIGENTATGFLAAVATRLSVIAIGRVQVIP
ncbi:MAG: hypothetical protein ACRDNT_29900 [Streptosporangiaceae bacterium]